MADEQQRAKDSERSVASNRHAREDAGNTNDDDARNQGRPETGPSQPPAPFSQASQVGRARSGGSRGSALEPGGTVREGWAAPDQTETPREWPEPTID